VDLKVSIAKSSREKELRMWGHPLTTREAKKRESGIEVANIVRPDPLSMIVVEVILEASREG